MNIFVLDLDPALAAEYHCDKHVVKMVLESAQILSTVNALRGNEGFYKPTHQRHPCVIWANSNITRYRWLWQLACSLSQEYTHRYGKVHKSFSVILDMANDPSDMHDGNLAPFALAMPTYCKTECPVESYRNYYMAKKADICKWTNRNVPEWFGE